MSGWFFSPWWPSHFSSFAPGWSGLCAGSRGGIPDILVVCFIASMLGVVFLVFVHSLFRFAVGGLLQGVGGGIILTCPLCKLNVVIKNFVWYLFFVNTKCVN